MLFSVGLMLPLLALLVMVGIAIGAAVGLLLHRVFRSRSTFDATSAAVFAVAAGLAAFVLWCVIAGAVLYLLLTILFSGM